MTEDCPCTSPDAIAFGCGLALARIVKDKEVLEKKGSVLKHAGCLTLSIGEQLGDTPLTPIGSSADVSECPFDPECPDACAQYVLAECTESKVEGVKTMNPWVKLALLKLIDLAVEEVRKALAA